MKTINMVIVNTLDTIINNLHDKSQEEDYHLYWELYKSILQTARSAGWNYVVYEGYYNLAKGQYEKQ